MNHETDWTSRLPQTAHVQLFRDADWRSSDLGPLAEWGSSLRFAAAMVLADSRGACVYWGSQRIAFYNEAFVPMAGSAHPFLMGKGFAVGFPELNDAIGPVFAKAEADGMTVDVNNIPLFTERNGSLEETFFIGQFIPLRGDSGKVEGFYNTVYETTFRVLHDRRRKVLDLVTALPSSSMSSIYENAVGALETNPLDVPMLLLYSADEITAPGTCQLTLRSSIGVPANHILTPAQAELHQSREPLIDLFRKARARGAPLVIRTDDESLQKDGASLLSGISWTGFGEQCEHIVVAPMATASRLFGFIVLATNPRRKYDVTCEQFHNDIVQQLLAKLNSAVSVEDARAREESLVKDLAESERRIRFMAMYAPLGMVHMDVAGTVVWANDQYYDILGISKEAAATSMSFLDVYHLDSLEEAQKLWFQLLDGNPAVSSEFKLKRLFAPPSGPPEHACVLGHGFPLKEDGKVRYIMGFFTDVSRLKWAENLQTLNASAAREAKRQQELFIDVTSHELRNPLGAVMQCAEDISSSLQRAGIHDALQILRENVETAETILACAKHQKRIIDDVLLLSRLQSGMLSISPVQTNIETVVTSAERMFSGECKQDNIRFTVEQHQSLANHNVSSIMCDPSRLLQIIINILGNGVRFVRTEPRRELSVTYGAGETISEVYGFNSGVKWCPSLKTSEDLTLSSEWGHGQPLYVFFAIRDTGPGLRPQEIDRLFQRFVQSTKRTHIKYGGSGMGLYICRELAEKQGGEIGVVSKVGEGATFSFYIKTRRAEGHTTDAAPLPSRPRPHPTRKTSSQSSKRSLQVLLTEDNLVNQKFLKRGLEKNGCTVHLANHGLEAIDFLKRSACWKNQNNGVVLDLILMDWEMPILDGLATSKRIRELETRGDITRHIPIIGTTANARSEQIQKAFDAGMDDVLTKPFLMADMMHKINKWMAKDEVERIGT